MGFKRTRVDELGALIAEKDARIERLELEVQAFAARASHIQSRFLATLDTLDELQEKHRLELSEMTEEITALRAKLSRYVSRVKEAEAERDDMREAVVELVEKDLHADEDVYAYASAMIAALRVERDLERKAHSQTRRDTEYRITALEAQLARRDAELEACIYHTEHRAKIQSTDKKYRSNKTPSGGACSMTDEDIISVLEATAAKNRALELEVKQIAAQLERARLVSVTSPLIASQRPELPSHVSPTCPTSTSEEKISLASSFPARNGDGMAPTGAPVPRRNHGEVPSEPLSRSPTVAPGDDVPCSKGRPSIPIIPGSPGHVSLIDARLGGGGPERDLVPASGNPTIAALDRQIALLGRQVDAFREERDKLAQLVWGERADIDIGPSRTETPHQAPGPARRERSQPRIREAQPSHADLLAEIRKVQDLLLLRAVPAASDAQTLTHDEEDLLPITQEQESGTDGERSMELATPLMPSIAVPDPAHADANVNGMSPFLLPRTDELAGPPAEEEEEEEEEGVLIDL